MNLFLLHSNAEIAAQMHCDKHCIKMIIEVMQLLYTAWWLAEEGPPEWKLKPYKPTHVRHPTCIWIRSAESNYNWAARHAQALCKEYTRRYGKTHACEEHLQYLVELGSPKPSATTSDLSSNSKTKIATVDIPEGCSDFYCAVPDAVFPECSTIVDGQLSGCQTYRKYYKTKGWTMKWNRGKDVCPLWYRDAPKIRPKIRVRPRHTALKP